MRLFAIPVEMYVDKLTGLELEGLLSARLKAKCLTPGVMSLAHSRIRGNVFQLIFGTFGFRDVLTQPADPR